MPAKQTSAVKKGLKPGKRLVTAHRRRGTRTT